MTEVVTCTTTMITKKTEREMTPFKKDENTVSQLLPGSFSFCFQLRTETTNNTVAYQLLMILPVIRDRAAFHNDEALLQPLARPNPIVLLALLA